MPHRRENTAQRFSSIAKMAGFPTAGSGWDFVRRVSIGDVRGACQHGPISGRCGIARTLRPDGLGKTWGKAAHQGVVLVPNRRSQRVCLVRDSRMTRWRAVQRIGRYTAASSRPVN